MVSIHHILWYNPVSPKKDGQNIIHVVVLEQVPETIPFEKSLFFFLE